MPDQEYNQEGLREALLHVERLREKERLAREQMETLITGLQILNESSSVAEMFLEILGALQKVVTFDCAAILELNSANCLSTAVSTDDRLKFSKLPVTGIFKRALDGRSTAITDLSKVPDWPVEISVNDKSALRSAMVTCLPGLARPTLMVCASSVRAKFKKTDLHLLQTFSPLATQAVQRATEMEELNILVNKLDYYAHFDMLTGLGNRTLFDQRLAHIVKTHDCSVSVLFLDLDNFKKINDTYGHLAGDILLSDIAFRISSVLEESDTVARMGGDEFAIILRNKKDITEVFGLCEHLIKRINEPVFLRQSRIVPSASIGIYMCAPDESSTEAIMQNADIALYDAKSRGRNCFSLFNLEMRAQLDRRRNIEARIRTALAAKELTLEYQPIYDADNFDCSCVEALLRWDISESVSYLPDEFIPVAETTGDISVLGLWVLEQTLVELSPWLTDDRSRCVAINVSDIQLHDPKLSESFQQIVANSDVLANQVELELSEKIVASCINEIVLENLRSLKSVGFKFSYDDFGTGQSSFLHLQKLPGTKLKIDRSFIADIEQGEDSCNLVAGIVDFAHHLKLTVVAEGVETRGQTQLLQALGCDLLQGFYLAKPMSSEKCMMLLANNKASEAVVIDNYGGRRHAG